MEGALSICRFVAKLFRFKKYLKVTDIRFENYGKTLKILVKPYKNGCRCPDCGRRCKIVKLMDRREWREIAIFDIEVFLVFTPREIRCPTHGRQQEEIPWAEWYSRYTYRMEYAVARLAQSMNQKSAAKLLGISKSTYSDLLHRIINRERMGHKIRGLKTIGVDEISYLKGKKFATVVYDLDKGKVLWVGKGKAKATLEWFFKHKLTPHQRDKVEVACCDMARGYTESIKENLPNVKLVIDRFHVVKALNEAVDEVRKEAWRELDKEQRSAFKGIRWLLYFHSSNRSKADTRALNKLRKSNNRIYRAWVLKDEFEHFWEYVYEGSARKFLKQWCTRALKSRLEPLRKFVGTLRRHMEAIVPFIHTHVTNAKAEGINRLLRMVKNRASGFRNFEAFADIIYLTNGDLDIPACIPEKFRTLMI